MVSAHQILDPIRLEVFKNALLATTDELSVALQRSAYSTNIKTRLDSSCAIVDSRLRIVAQALARPSHLDSLPHRIPSALPEYGLEHLGEGDALIVNDSSRGSPHLDDIALISPIYDAETQDLVGVVANKAYHVDVGGNALGSLAPARELYQEGLVIPPMRSVEAGEINQDILRLIRAGFRSPDESMGDSRAQREGHKHGANAGCAVAGACRHRRRWDHGIERRLPPCQVRLA